MTRTNDGFEISEADLQLRGPGDMEGTQQSGIAFDLRIANIAKDGQILQLARDIAGEVLDADPDWRNPRMPYYLVGWKNFSVGKSISA